MSEPKPTDPGTAERLRIEPDALRWTCDTADLPFETTAEVEPESGIIGQDDAIEALRFGLESFAPGQNVYVRGLTGTGRLTLVQRVLAETQPSCQLAQDYAFATNFASPSEPRLLTLARGRGNAFRDAIDVLIDFLQSDLGPALQSDGLRARRKYVDERFESEAQDVMKPLEKELKENELALVSVKVGNNMHPAVLPLIDGEPAPPERVQSLLSAGKLTEEEIERLNELVTAWATRVEEMAIKLRDVGVRHGEAVRALFRGEVRSLVKQELRPIQQAFPGESVAAFLAELLEDVVRSNVDEFATSESAVRRLRVNVVLGHAPDEGCPVIVETTPTLGNLLGSVDRRVLPEGLVVSDHLMITPGSLLRADGGYLILETREVLREAGAWKVLMRTLRTGCLEIVPSELNGPWSVSALKPERIPLDVKVVLIGDPGLYYALDAQDPDFPNLFKVLADFDSVIPRDALGLSAYSGLFARIAEEENLPAFERSAVAALAEHGARIAGRNDRLTTRFGRLVDIAREAAYLTGKSEHTYVSGDDVRAAIRRGKRRGDLPARKFRDSIARGTVFVATDGRTVGQVNGLAVIHAGPLVYGFPARITATIAAGHAGMINIERESQLSGAIHTKGFYILGGLLRHLLQTEHPLAFSASIAFEQSYGGIDGDSASGAEMCCLISALTSVPLRQDLAMTGAIDQHGRILPIGAATEKIEGFFDACVDAGLTGEQGVIIPHTNRGDLMLRHDVVEACREGRFRVIAVETIQQALEVFTGISAGTRDEETGEYSEGTLLHTAVERAFEFWALASGKAFDLEAVASEEAPVATEEATE